MKLRMNKLLKLLFCFLTLSVFFPAIYLVTEYSLINKIYNILLIPISIIIISIYIKNTKISKVIFLIFLYLMTLFFSTILNSGDIIGCIYLITKTFVFCVFTDYSIKREKNIFLSMFIFYFSLMIFINLITLIIYPAGMYKNLVGYNEYWFLGNKNNIILYILPSILISIIKDFQTSNKIKINTYLLMLLSMLSLILCKSSTSLVALSLILIAVLFKKILNNVKVFNIKNYFIIYLSLFFMIVIFRLQNCFKFLIVDILGKNLTFTSRTYIWDFVLNLISKKPIIGYGYEYSYLRLTKLLSVPSYHAHDFILEVIYKTGLLGIILIGLIFINCFKQIYLYKSTKIGKIMSFIIFCLLIMMITEFYSFQYILYIFVIGYNIKFLVKKED